LLTRGTELAALTGMGDRNTPSMYPGRDTLTAGRVSDRTLPASGRAYDPTEDDPIEPVAPSLKSGSYGDNAAFVVTPSIQVLPEFPSLTRNTEPTQALTCIVVVELPGKRGPGHVPGPVIDPYTTHNVPEASTVRRRQPSLVPPTVPSHDSQPSRDPPYASTIQSQEASPFVAITEDLRNRIIDWKGHPLSGLGHLQMYDLLSVRRDALVREFYVYLFREAIICVAEEKKRSLGRFLSSASGAASTFTDGASVTSGATGQSKGVLRLKGRIYIKHIRQVTDTSIQGELSLTIDMEDERLDSFILIFKDRSSLETWKANVQSLVSHIHGPRREPEHPPLDMEEFGGSAKAMRMLSGSTGTSSSTAESSLLHSSSGRSTLSSYTSHGSVMNHGFHGSATGKLSPLQEDETPSHYSSGPLYAPHMSAGPSNSLAPLPHPPLDLILVISLPPIHSSPSTAALKRRVIKASLDFIIASLGPRDRLSFVTFEVGLGGAVRKTPFQSLGRAESRTRLSKFVDEIGFRPEKDEVFEDEFLVRGNKEEKTDVVTAVNHGMTLSN
jgi:PH (Pleckstrin Homology) domain-containing protein